MTICGNSLSRSLSGVKRTWLFALHMSAFDPKRTLQPIRRSLVGPFAMPADAIGQSEQQGSDHKYEVNADEPGELLVVQT